MRSKLRVVALVCGLAALGLFGYAVWLLAPPLSLMSRTKKVSAEAVHKDDPEGKTRMRRVSTQRQPELLRDHDSEGYGVFGLRIPFVYFLDGKRHFSFAETPVKSRDVVRVLKMREDYEEGTQHEIRYNPAKPEEIYVEAGIPDRIWEPALTSVLAGLGALVLGFVSYRMSRPPTMCAACGQVEIERYYKFCPGCCATVSAK